KDGLCPLMPLWNTMLIFEFTFLALIGLSLFLDPGRPSAAIFFSLFFIIPTTASLLGVIYYCKRQEAKSPFWRDTDPSTDEADPSRGGDTDPSTDEADPSRGGDTDPPAGGDGDPSRED
ncbi:MAG: hypothetical protein V5A55_13290, partial [Halovenus sp.]